MNQQVGRIIEKIRAFHPEIDRNNVDLMVSWDEAGKR